MLERAHDALSVENGKQGGVFAQQAGHTVKIIAFIVGVYGSSDAQRTKKREGQDLTSVHPVASLISLHRMQWTVSSKFPG